MNFHHFFTTNTWWGKIIGGFLGFIMHGPAGALFGILIGNLFDRGLASHFSRPHGSYHQEKRQNVQKIFFQATFTIMGHVAKSDGRVSENEIDMARQMMMEMRLNQEQKEEAQWFFNTGKKANFNLEDMLTLLQTTCRDNPELLKLFMDIQYRAAQVDGLSNAKVSVLDYIFKRLGFIPLHQQYRFYEDFGHQHRASSNSSQSGTNNNSRYHSSSNQSSHRRTYTNQTNNQNILAHAYALLEVSETASKQEVKRAYRRSISRNHPDKLIAQGLPEEMIKIANDKTQKITKAYEQICASKGW